MTKVHPNAGRKNTLCRASGGKNVNTSLMQATLIGDDLGENIHHDDDDVDDICFISLLAKSKNSCSKFQTNV